jgi:hypothetical protein
MSDKLNENDLETNDPENSVPVKTTKTGKQVKVKQTKKRKIHAIQTIEQATANQADVIVEQLHNLKAILNELENHADKLTTPEKIIGSYNIGVCIGIISISSNLIGLETHDTISTSIQGFLDRMKEDDFTGSDCEFTPGISPECESCKSKTLCLLLIERE